MYLLGRIQDFWKEGSYVISVCVWGGGGMGGSFCQFYLIFLKYPMKMKSFGLYLLDCASRNGSG